MHTKPSTVTDLMQVSTTHFLNRLVVIAVLFCVSGHGSCMCDSYKSESYCDCEQGYLGADCSCPVSTLSCRTQNGTGVCSCYLTYLTTCGTFHHECPWLLKTFKCINIVVCISHGDSSVLLRNLQLIHNFRRFAMAKENVIADSVLVQMHATKEEPVISLNQ